MFFHVNDGGSGVAVGSLGLTNGRLMTDVYFFYCYRFVDDLPNMQNDAGEFVDLYVPRKW